MTEISMNLDEIFDFVEKYEGEFCLNISLGEEGEHGEDGKSGESVSGGVHPAEA